MPSPSANNQWQLYRHIGKIEKKSLKLIISKKSVLFIAIDSIIEKIYTKSFIYNIFIVNKDIILKLMNSNSTI